MNADNPRARFAVSGCVLDREQRASQEQGGMLKCPRTLRLTLSRVRLTASGQEQTPENMAEKGEITLIKENNRTLPRSHSSPGCAPGTPDGSKGRKTPAIVWKDRRLKHTFSMKTRIIKLIFIFSLVSPVQTDMQPERVKHTRGSLGRSRFLPSYAHFP